MSTIFHKLSLILSMACVALSPLAQAQVINFTVQGNVLDTVCTPTMSGQGVSGNTVTLPNVTLVDLQTIGDTIGDREILFKATNCAMSGSTNNMWVHFTSPQVIAGRMVPQTGITDLHFEIQDADSSGTPIGLITVSASGATAGTQPGGGQGTTAQFTGIYPNRVVEKKYVIRYYVAAPVSQGGALSTPATYEVKYY